MIRKPLFVLFLLLASLTLLIACGEDEDSSNNDRPDFSTSGSDTSGADVADSSGSTSGPDEDTSGTSGTNEDTSGTSGTVDDTSSSGTDTSPPDDTSGSTSGDTSGNTSGDTSGSTCTDACCRNTLYSGQVFQDVAPDPDSVNGGVVRTEPYDPLYDAGLAAIRAAVPAGTTDPLTIDLDVTEATVTAVGFKPAAATGYSNFWLSDGQASIQVFLGTDTARANAPATIRVGQKVSFTATEGDLYRDQPQITNLDGASWTVNSEDNQVYINDIEAGDEITVADVQNIIRVTGTLATAGVECGGSSLCYDYDYGAASPVVLRVNSNFLGGSLAVGDCVTFVGPVGVFDGLVQLDASQFDWLWRNNNTAP